MHLGMTRSVATSGSELGQDRRECVKGIADDVLLPAS